MKKLFSMLLMLCAVVTFTACSSDDEGGESPTGSVTDVVLPTSAKIGTEITVQGKGFTSSQKFYLNDAEYFAAWPISLDNVKVTSSGITFTVPYDLTAGMTARLVMEEGEKSYTLGTMTILAADNPVSLVSIPSEMPLLADAVTITGAGFAEGDVICLAVNDDDERIKLETTLTDGGVSVNTTTALEGDVNVYLQRGNSEWKIGTTYAYFERYISSITISDNMYLQMVGLKDGESLKLDMKYDEDGALQSFSSNAEGVNCEFTYSGNTISYQYLKSDDTYFTCTYTLDDQKRIVSSTSWDDYASEAVNYTWTYDAYGHLVRISASGEDSEDLLAASYSDGNNMTSYTFSVDNEMESDNTSRAFIGTVEPAYLLNAFSWLLTKEDLFFGFLLNRNVKTSSYLLNKFSATDYNEDGTAFVMKAHTVDAKADHSSIADVNEGSLTLQTSGSGFLSMASSLLFNKVVVDYKIKRQK